MASEPSNNISNALPQQGNIITTHDIRGHDVNQLPERSNPDTFFHKHRLNRFHIHRLFHFNNANRAQYTDILNSG